MNQLPQATAFEIKPDDLMPKSVRRKDWFSPHGAPRKSAGLKPSLHVVRPAKPRPVTPLWQQEEITFDAHEEFLAEWRINRPRAYVIAQAKAAGYCLADMTGNLRPHALVAVRQRLMAEVWQLFGLTLNQIGKLFGGRDNSTVTHALRKHGIKSVQILPLAEKGDEIFTLWRAGLNQQAIAQQLGYTQSSVCRYMRKQDWWPKPQKREYVRDHAETIKAMLKLGKSLRSIGRVIGFKPDAIAIYARKAGLLPPPDIRYIEDSADQIHQMVRKGATYGQMARATGFHPSAIGKFVRKQGWRR